MALITNIKPREYVGNQPFRAWERMHYRECLNQAARVNASLNCDGCIMYTSKENLGFNGIEIEAKM